MLGGVLFDRGRMEDALAALRQVREVDPGFVNAQTVIGEIAVRQRRLAEAERSFRRAAGLNRRAVEPLERLASLLSLERRPAEARSVLRQLFQITRDPRHLADSILISELESEVRDRNPELEEFRKQTPDDPWLARVWGLSLLSRGRSAEALPHLEAAAMAFDEDPLGRFALAECRLALGIPVDDVSVLGSPPSRAADAGAMVGLARPAGRGSRPARGGPRRPAEGRSRSIRGMPRASSGWVRSWCVGAIANAARSTSIARRRSASRKIT